MSGLTRQEKLLVFMKMNNDFTVKQKASQEIIKFHELGYIYDFYLAFDELVCLQDMTRFSVLDSNICVADQFYDEESQLFHYLHIITTWSGYKGLLFANYIVTEISILTNKYNNENKHWNYAGTSQQSITNS